MISLLRTLAYPIISLVLIILGNGLFTTFISMRLDIAQHSPETIGLVASAFYAGILAGSLTAPAWIARLGHLRLLFILCAANSGIILIQAIWVDPIFWACMRFLGGLTMGSMFVVIESWFLLISSRENRGQALSLYLLIFYAALSVGQLLINVANPHSYIPYCLASFLSTAAILPLSICKFETPAHENRERFSFLKVFCTSPKGFMGGIVSGMLLASIYGLGPIYGQAEGLSISEVGTLMAIIIFGGLSLQWPIGKWADGSSRRGVLVFACFAAALFSLLIAFNNEASWPLRLTLLWLFGGFSFVLYPLSMAFTCDSVAETQIVSATGGFVLSYGIGAIAGPLLAPLFMDMLGSGGLFYFNGMICSMMGFIGLLPKLYRS